MLKAQPGRAGGRAFEVRTTARGSERPVRHGRRAVSFGGAGGAHRGVHGCRRRRWNRWPRLSRRTARRTEAAGGLRRSDAKFSPRCRRFSAWNLTYDPGKRPRHRAGEPHVERELGRLRAVRLGHLLRVVHVRPVQPGSGLRERGGGNQGHHAPRLYSELRRRPTTFRATTGRSRRWAV